MNAPIHTSTFYLDHCGSTPLDKSVKLHMLELLKSDHFGNPTAVHHQIGREANELLEGARATIATELNVAPQQILFTSGATEANNLVLTGFWLRFKDRGCRILFGATEHKSVLEPAQRIAELAHGFAAEIGVDCTGQLNLEHLESLLKDNPKNLPTLVAVMHTNNEIAVRHPVEDVISLCETYGAYFHCDGVQGFVREKIDFQKTRYGSFVISTHKIYGPKGLGILAIGPHNTAPLLSPLIAGGEQEFGLRAGTQNVLAISAGAKAVENHALRRQRLVEHLKICDASFVQEMTKHVPGFQLTVPLSMSAAGIVNFYIEKVDAPSLLLKLDQVCINRGASCTGAGGEKFSHVPKALGLPIEIQANVLRASFGWASSPQDMAEVARLIALAVKKVLL